MASHEIMGTYGKSKTLCLVFVVDDGLGSWYCVEGSMNGNYTYQTLTEGVDIETVEDWNTFTASAPMDTIEDLEQEIDQ